MAILEAIEGNLDVPAGDVKRAEPAIMKLDVLAAMMGFVPWQLAGHKGHLCRKTACHSSDVHSRAKPASTLCRCEGNLTVENIVLSHPGSAPNALAEVWPLAGEAVSPAHAPYVTVQTYFRW